MIQRKKNSVQERCPFARIAIHSRIYTKSNADFVILELVDLVLNTENGELIWSTRVNGDLENNYRSVLNQLSDTVRNYMEIKALEENDML